MSDLFEMPEHLRPVKEEDAPEGYMLCSNCNGEKLLGPDGEACTCGRWGKHQGYMLKPENRRSAKVTTHRTDPALEVKYWNGKHHIGTLVRYWPGVRPGISHTGRTRSLAKVLGGHTAVVWVEGYSSCLSLTHVAVEDA